MASLSSIRFPELPRAALRQQLISLARVPERHVDEVTDLACHAADSGLRKVLEVLDHATAPVVALAALGPALAMLRSQVEALEASLRSLDGTAGVSVTTGSIEVPANG